jgi:hypothetical protein
MCTVTGLITEKNYQPILIIYRKYPYFFLLYTSVLAGPFVREGVSIKMLLACAHQNRKKKRKEFHADFWLQDNKIDKCITSQLEQVSWAMEN